VGRARVLIGAWDSSQERFFAVWTDELFARVPDANWSMQQSANALTRMLNLISEARNELCLITGGRVSAAFDAGQPFAFYDELRKVVETAQKDVLFVDRYMGADFVSSYLPHVRTEVSLRLLTRDLVVKLTASVAEAIWAAATEVRAL
jgi:hypothetical protein